MIGLIANSRDNDVAHEFFELFKTPWEFYRGDQPYDVVLCTEDGPADVTAKIVLYYAATKLRCDDRQTCTTTENGQHRRLEYKGIRIPIYGKIILFPEQERRLLRDETSGLCIAYKKHCEGRLIVRIGYDLFSEVRTLLTVGQPIANAHFPTLELHIGLLRDLITGHGIPLVEIPPVPEGNRFIVCLTHDVDHPSIRKHRFDHTMYGFLYRALVGSSGKLLRREISIQDILRNWGAALRLPFVYTRLAKDFWREFAIRYLQIEAGLCSTFFVIPFKNYPGSSSSGRAPVFRASRYAAKDIEDVIHTLLDAGCEVGAHGLDAWLDSSKGRDELDEIRRLTGVSELGIRMHWLYYDEHSPSALEDAGASYDSTMGYNETVGYRAGTTQAYRPLRASHLLELPLHVMDTALFYPCHLGVSSSESMAVLDRMIDNAAQYGGCLTINWHDRSILPERLWESPYRDLLKKLKKKRAWFSTAGQAVSWFRKRRAAVFKTNPVDMSSTAVAEIDADRHSPKLLLRIHNGHLSNRGPETFTDTTVEERIHLKDNCECCQRYSRFSVGAKFEHGGT